MRMISAILVLLLCTLSGCVKVPPVEKTPSNPPDALKEDPEETHIIDEGSADSVEFGFEAVEGTSADQMQCSVEKVVYRTESEIIDGSVLGSIPGVVDSTGGTYEVDPQPGLSTARSVHLSEASVILLQGKNLDFVEAVRIWVGEKGTVLTEEDLVAWKDEVPSGTRSLALRIDGSMNLRDALVDGTTLHYLVYASPPSTTVEIRGELVFLGSNCSTVE